MKIAISLLTLVTCASLAFGQRFKHNPWVYVTTGRWNLVSCKKNGATCPEYDLDAARQSMLYARDNPDDKRDRITAIVEIMCMKDEGICVLAVPSVPWTEEAIADVHLDSFKIRKWDDGGIDADSLTAIQDDACLKSNPSAKAGSELHIEFSNRIDSISETDYVSGVSCPPEERVFQFVDDDEHRHKHTFVNKNLGVHTR
jgi:hypothetical protein